MRMRPESLARCNPILIDHAQASEPIVLVVLVHGERKRMERLEPAVVGVPSILRVSGHDRESRIGRARGARHGGNWSEDGGGAEQSLGGVQGLPEKDCLQNDGHEADKEDLGKLGKRGLGLGICRVWLTLQRR